MTAPLLQGKTVRLEPLTEAHLEGIYRVACDPSIWTHMTGAIFDRASLQRWFETAQRLTPYTWVTVLQTTNEVIGSTRFADLDLHHRTVEIGYTWLSSSQRGSKANPEAKLLQLRHAFEDLKLRRVALKTHHENLRSQAAIRKLGAKYEGTFRNHMIMDDGSQRHSAWFSITPEEWPTVQENLLRRL